VDSVTPEILKDDNKPNTIIALELEKHSNADSFLSKPEVSPLLTLRQKTTTSNLLKCEVCHDEIHCMLISNNLF
jgi:uncharacterized protein (DUF1330 family)